MVYVSQKSHCSDDAGDEVESTLHNQHAVALDNDAQSYCSATE